MVFGFTLLPARVSRQFHLYTRLDMDGHQNYRATYDLRRVILFGAVASSSLIFSVLFFLFLGSFSSHPGYSTDTISEMMGYAEFFLFAYGSYFAAAVLVWYSASHVSKAASSWLPIVVFGSILFSASFLIRVWISDLITYQENNPFRAPPPGFGMVVVSILAVAGISFLVTSIGCGIASAFITAERKVEVVPK